MAVQGEGRLVALRWSKGDVALAEWSNLARLFVNFYQFVGQHGRRF
jgi:hypothetical protein